MIDLLRHRGPDDAGLYQGGAAVLGHARLSIIDLGGGHQPLCNEDESIWTTFNGEIFNYVELRHRLLSRGHTLRTHSDTEVLVHLYEDLGADMVHELNGQFAFAIWDARRGRLLLARDRVGIRPLFYTRVGDRLLFASEIKALLSCTGVERRLDLQALSEVFTCWAPLPPRTPFAGIHCLPPGHVLVAEARAGTIATRRYWDWTFPRQAPDGDLHAPAIADTAAEVRSLLVDSVRLQLRADVPVGAYLSGGLDSSIITSMIRRYTGSPLRTFSLTFEDDEFDERPYQEELSRYLQTDHEPLVCRRADIAAAFPEAVYHAELPLFRTAPVPLMLLAGLVRQRGFKVVLTGEGADEVFGGYDLFKEAAARRFWARDPDSKLRPQILNRLYPYLRNSPAASPAYAQAFFRQGFDQPDLPYFGHLPRFTTTRRALRFLSADVRATLASDDPLARLSASLPADLMTWAPLCRDQYIEAHTLMSGYLLSAQGDRMAMARSIEGRFPFLDHRVIEHANRLPPTHKLLGLHEKRVLREAAADLLPPRIGRRPKQPYRAPEAACFFRDGQPLPWVADLLAPARLADSGLFDPAASALLLRKCQAGQATGFADNLAFVALLSTQLLHEMFVRPARIDKDAHRAFADATGVLTP